MSEDKKSLIDLIPDSVDNAVKNITDKPTQNIGTTFADIWYLVFGGISQAAEKRKLKYSYALRKFEIELKEKISKIPEDKLTEPDTQTSAQALENSKYCIDKEELRKMFVSLISNSMNSDFNKDMHPSFAEIIKQMSTLDAKVIKTFKNSSTNGFPLCQYVVNRDNGYTLLLENVYLNYSTSYLPDCSLSIASLVRLGLLNTSYETHFTDDAYYTPFTEHSWFKKLQQEFNNQNVSINKGRVYLTPLGRSFTRVCIPD